MTEENKKDDQTAAREASLSASHGSGSFYAANVKLVEETAKRVTNVEIIAELGGSICVSGRTLEGEEAVKYIDRMDLTDRMTMIEDMLSVGYFPQNDKSTCEGKANE